MFCFPFCREVSERPHIVWLDNFSKLYYRTKPDVDNGTLHHGLWSGVALIEWDGASDVSLKVVRFQDGSVMSALPPRLFTCLFDRYTTSSLADVDSQGMNMLDNSICSRYNVNNVPLKPVVDVRVEPGLHALLERRGDGMQNLFPKRLIKKNIGKNTDFLSVVRDQVLQIESSRPARYGILLADIDIFIRCIKVWDLRL